MSEVAKRNSGNNKARKAYCREWANRNYLRLKLKRQALWEKHPEKKKEYRDKKIKYYWANIERERMRRKKYYLNNKTKAIQDAANWQSKNKDHYLSSRRERYAKPDCLRRAKGKVYAKRRMENGKAATYNKAYRNIQREKLTDFYVRQQLAKRSLLKPHQFPDELVEAKRMQLLIKTKLYEKCNSTQK